MDGRRAARLFGFWGTKALRGRSRGGERGGQTQSCRKPARTDGRREANQPPAATDGCAEISPNGLLSKGAECAAREGADANPRTNDTMARDALPVNCCPAHSGFVYLSAKLTTGGGKRRSTRVFLAKIRREWKSAGKENNIGGKESAMADGERKHLFSTRHSISSQKPTAKIANVPRMGRERGRKVCGKLFVSAAERNCIGNDLSSCSKNLPLSTRVSNFICGGGDRQRRRLR